MQSDCSATAFLPSTFLSQSELHSSCRLPRRLRVLRSRAAILLLIIALSEAASSFGHAALHAHGEPQHQRRRTSVALVSSRLRRARFCFAGRVVEAQAKAQAGTRLPGVLGLEVRAACWLRTLSCMDRGG
mmetsp:Transcript_34288/g.72200  ORF Transcript_34288/g.72200 Transcript_34288/m.72200 type:complete len:130 (+) Transcript_34288:406-795(+)